MGEGIESRTAGWEPAVLTPRPWVIILYSSLPNKRRDEFINLRNFSTRLRTYLDAFLPFWENFRGLRLLILKNISHGYVDLKAYVYLKPWSICMVYGFQNTIFGTSIQVSTLSKFFTIINSKSEEKKQDTLRNWPLMKNLQFLSNLHETWWK